MTTTPVGPSRRAVTKSAAWATPLIMAAVAAPTASASPVPACPNCFKPGSIGVTTMQSLVVGNRGPLAFTTFVNIDATGCDLSLFSPTYTVLATSATLTMTNGTTYTQAVGLGAGQGTFGQVSAINLSFLFNNIFFPNGAAFLGSYPVMPKKLCVNFTFILEGLPYLVKIECPQTLCWNINTVATGGVLFGAGTLNFTGTFSPAI
jgi:hypothetical protein